MEFAEWFAKQMDRQGYKSKWSDSYWNVPNALSWVESSSVDGDKFLTVFVDKPLTEEIVRTIFEGAHEPVLFVVDIELLTSLTSDAPMWIRALHAIYYGRVYCWNTQGIKAMHFDWSNSTLHSSEYIEIDGILFTDTDCKLRDFPGVFHIARFYDRAFWKEQPEQPEQPEPPPKRKKPRSNPNESFWKEEWARQNNTPPKEDDIFEAFKRAFEEQMRRAQASQQQTYNQTPNRYAPTGDKWLQQFINTGSLAAAKTMYRQLGKEWHPDLNPGKPQAHETMQAINIAYDKAKAILR